jgi:Fur family transcriptional regulator, peroxide stress response regulator
MFAHTSRFSLQNPPKGSRFRVHQTGESSSPMKISNDIPVPARVADSTLRRVLDAHGHRYTEQRAAVYRFLCGTAAHPTADEVFTTVRGEISDISLATVYKTLETLVACGLVTKLSFGDGSARYDARTEDHFHSRCLICGAVRDVPLSQLQGALPQVHLTGGFRVEGLRLEVIGHCADCT